MHALVRHSHSPAQLAGMQQSALMHQPRPGHPAWQPLSRTTVTTAATQGFHHSSSHPHVVSTFQQGAQQLGSRHGFMLSHAGHGQLPPGQQQGPPSQLLSPRGPSPAEFASMQRQRFAEPPFAQQQPGMLYAAHAAALPMLQQATGTPGGWRHPSASPGLAGTPGLRGGADMGFEAQLMGDQHGARNSFGGGSSSLSPLVDPAAAAAQPRGVLSMLASRGPLPGLPPQLGQPPGGGMQAGRSTVSGLAPQVQQPGPPFVSPQLPLQQAGSPFCSAQAQFGSFSSGPAGFQEPLGAFMGQLQGPPQQLNRAMSHHAGLGSSDSGGSGYVPHPGAGPPLHYVEQRAPPPLHRIGSAPLLSSGSGSMVPGGPGHLPYAPMPSLPESWLPPREHRAAGSPHPGALGPGHALPPHHAAAADVAAAAAGPWGAGVAPAPERRPHGRPPKTLRLSLNPGAAADGGIGSMGSGAFGPAASGQQASGSSGSGGGSQRKRSSTSSGMDVLKPVKSLKVRGQKQPA